MSNKARIREEARLLNPIDNAMFNVMGQSGQFLQEILRTFLEDQNLIITKHHVQHTLTNLQGRSVIVDAICTLGDGRQTLVEIQKADDDDHQRRVRYESSVLTANITNPGSRFRNISDICVVYVSRFDLFRGGYALYHIDRIVRELGIKVENGLSEVYVNGASKDGSASAELMKVFTEDGAYSSRFPITSGIKRRLKITEEGRTQMGDIMSDLFEELYRDQLNAEVEATVQKRTQELVEKRMSQVREELGAKIRDEIRDEVRSEVRDEVRSEVRDEVRSEVRDEVRSEVRDEVLKEEKRINELTIVLISAGRIADLEAAARDKEYQKRLMEDLLPKPDPH